MQDEWTEKYRPRSLDDVAGNETAIKTIRRWAESWKKGAPRYKAIVLRGEPGIGKTSAALALANDMGWDFIEMNASDHRNAASIKKIAGAGSRAQTFTSNGEFLSSSEGRRKLVIIDEADNLFGREDFGGAKAIVETVRESAHPIVLIVNDYYELTRKASAIKTLADKAVFRRLDKESTIKVLRAIADSERISVRGDVFARIADNCGGDLRAAINDLQMIAEGRSEISSGDSESIGKRNQQKELGHALRMMFGASTLRDARDATLDLDRTPDELSKWIEENIPLEFKHTADMADAFDALSKSDVYLGWTRRLQHYGLWSYAKELMTGGVALSRKRGPRPSVYEYRFPGFFIMMSRAKGPRAARDSLASKLQRHLHTSKRCANESVLPYMAAMVRNDSELLLNMTAEFELDEGDVAHLLGAEPDSKRVQDVLSEARGTDDREAPTRKKKARPLRRSKELSGF
ncbi:MAG: replication factor C large subunit [Candidatus Thermoplasmatota archaeon]|nr:replication factor C large subunit [Candidatus Thermoplasmatota archaeon]